MTVNVNARSHPLQFGHVHESVFEDRFGNCSSPISLRHKRHVLCLHVGGKSRMWLSRNIPRLQPRVAADAQRALI